MPILRGSAFSKTCWGGQKTPVSNLALGASYSFRYLAIGQGGKTPGQEASISLPLALTLWRAGSPIECRGIRWPLPGATISKGTQSKVSAYVATDFDSRDILTAAGVRSDRFLDACTYTWTCDNACYAAGGGFVSGGVRTQGFVKQSPMFLAPTTPGTYTLTLVVADQGSSNIGNGEVGSRNDAPLGFNDDPVRFSVTISVTP